VPHLATCIFLFLYNEPELGVGIDPGMALTPLPIEPMTLIPDLMLPFPRKLTNALKFNNFSDIFSKDKAKKMKSAFFQTKEV